MPDRLPNATLERALHVALDGLRGEHRFRLADSVLTIQRGWRVRTLLWSLAGLLAVAAVFVVIVSLWLPTPEQAVPTWARIVLALLLGLGTLGAVLSTRPVGVRIDAQQRRIHGRGGERRFDVQLSAAACLRITRSVVDEQTGNGVIELLDADASYVVLDVTDVSYAVLTRLEVLAIALSAWLELPWRDASDEQTLRRLAPDDEKVGVNKRDEGMSAGDIVVAALEILAALG
jgi:hypothetical protein